HYSAIGGQATNSPLLSGTAGGYREVGLLVKTHAKSLLTTVACCCATGPPYTMLAKRLTNHEGEGMSPLVVQPSAGTGEILSLTQERAGWQTVSLRLLRLEKKHTHVISQPYEEVTL